MKYPEAIFALTTFVVLPPRPRRRLAPARLQITGTVTAVNASTNQVSVKDHDRRIGRLDHHAPQLHSSLAAWRNRHRRRRPSGAIGDLTVGDGWSPPIKCHATRKSRKRARCLSHQGGSRCIWPKRMKRTGASAEPRAIWRRLDAAAKTFTIKVGSKDITVKPTDKTEYLRYSARFRQELRRQAEFVRRAQGRRRSSRARQ